MTTLHQLIKQNGQPEALVDHWDTDSRRYAVWGFVDWGIAGVIFAWLYNLINKKNN